VRQGCARLAQPVPEGDEREGANLKQPDSGEAGGAPKAARAHASFNRINPCACDTKAIAFLLRTTGITIRLTPTSRLKAGRALAGDRTC